MNKYKVIWDTYAKASLKSIVEYIKEDSPLAAQKVKNELLRISK
ncbi:MAG: type II toxin-antitoxin system RelE/ParE family toxin [Cyclobacteriaceae bacterium]|nr:type II toxin-antitoxin system RelE/ParE family toxin [Cyclobacteriaceae bacterium]